jgi:hypothetical protein
MELPEDVIPIAIDFDPVRVVLIYDLALAVELGWDYLPFKKQHW